MDEGADLSILTKINPRTGKGARSARDVANLYNQSAVESFLERAEAKIKSALPISTKTQAAKIARKNDAKLRAMDATKQPPKPVGSAVNVGQKGKIGGQVRTFEA